MHLSSRSKSALPRLTPWLRVMVYLVAIGAIALVASVRRAAAMIEEGAERAGLAVLERVGPVIVGSPEAVIINGQRMFLASKVTNLGVEEVLGRFESYCREHSGGLAEELGRLPASVAGHTIPENLRDPSRWMITRGQGRNGQTGQLGCLTRSESGGGLPALAKRIRAFLRTRDVSELGEPRYVIARRDVGSSETLVLVMWAEGRFSVPDMFPKEGDAPGNDSSDIPRPPNSKRVFHVAIESHAYVLRMYDTELSRETFLRRYDGEMIRGGWKVQDFPAARPGTFPIGDYARAYNKSGATVLAVVSETPAGKTGVSLLELGSLGVAGIP